MSQPLPKLDVEVDLRIDLDGKSATISSADNHLVVHAESPTDLVAAVLAGERPEKYRNLRGPRVLGAFADSLDTAGVELKVTGPSGTLLTLGSGQHWRWARLATGSVHVRPGGMAMLRPLLAKAVLERLRRSPPRARTTAVGVAAGAVLALTLRVRRSRRTVERTLFDRLREAVWVSFSGRCGQGRQWPSARSRP